MIGLISRSFINILAINQAWFGETLSLTKNIKDQSMKIKELKEEQNARHATEYKIIRSTTMAREN